MFCFNIRFHYALLVGADGKSFPDFAGFRSSGPVHAEVYWDLITRKEAENWDYRLVYTHATVQTFIVRGR